jgi:hypothetical protein
MTEGTYMDQRLYSVVDTRDGNRIIMANLLGLQSSTLCLELNDLDGMNGRYRIEPASIVDNWEDFCALVEAHHKNHVYPRDYYADDEERARS